MRAEQKHRWAIFPATKHLSACLPGDVGGAVGAAREMAVAFLFAALAGTWRKNQERYGRGARIPWQVEGWPVAEPAAPRDHWALCRRASTRLSGIFPPTVETGAGTTGAWMHCTMVAVLDGVPATHRGVCGVTGVRQGSPMVGAGARWRACSRRRGQGTTAGVVGRGGDSEP